MDDSQSGACMDQWRKYFCNAGVDIFEIIQRAIMLAACDHPQEFKSRRVEIAEALFSCNLKDSSRLNKCKNNTDNIGDLEHKASRQQYSKYMDGEVIKGETQLVGEVMTIKGMVDNCEDASTNDKEKNRLNGCMDVKEKMVVVDQGIEEPCLNEWEGLCCPPLDDLVFICAHPASPQMELSTVFDGIDDDYNIGSDVDYNKNDEKTPMRQGKQLKHGNGMESVKKKDQAPERQGKQLKHGNGMEYNREEKAPKRQGKQLKLVNDVYNKQSAGFKPNNTSASIGKRLGIPAKSKSLKSQVACEQHKPRVLIEKNVEHKLKMTKRKVQEKSGGVKSTTMQLTKVPEVDDVLKVHRVPNKPYNSDERTLEGRLKVIKRKFQEEKQEEKYTKRQRETESLEVQNLLKQWPPQKRLNTHCIHI